MNPKQRKSLALDDVWKSEEEIKKISQISPHYSREIRDYIKTLQRSLQILGFAWRFQLFSVFGNRWKSTYMNPYLKTMGFRNRMDTGHSANSSCSDEP